MKGAWLDATYGKDAAWGLLRGAVFAGYSVTKVADEYKTSRHRVYNALKSEAPPSATKAARPPPNSQFRRQRMARARETKRLAMKSKVVVQKKIVKARGRPRLDGKPRKQWTVTRRVRKLEFPSARKIAREMNLNGNFKTSRWKTARDLHMLGLKPYVRPVVQRVSATEIEKRLLFSRKMVRMPQSKFKKLIFSDEKWFDSNDNGDRFQWLQPCDRKTGCGVFPREHEEYAAKVLVWCAVGVGFRVLTICRWEGKGMTDAEYVTCCIDKLGRKNTLSGRIFMQDGATIHGTESVRAALKARYPGMEVLEGWPPHSPDLNPVERIWSILQREVSNRGPWTKEDLERFVMEEFVKIPQTDIDHMCNEFKVFCERCVENDGRPLGIKRYKPSRKREA